MASAAVDRNANGSAVWKMVFTAGSELHGASSPFLFSATTNLSGANNQTIAEILSKYYLSFALTLNPNTLALPGSTFWPSYIADGAGNTANGQNVGFTVLGITYTTIAPAPDQDVSPQCDFFNGQCLALSN
jgi:hypothetical protein